MQAMADRVYMCIDLKSFYASVECVERGLDPMKTRLVVADPDRTEKTICLAITPAMKALGVKNRCRVFEIPPGIDYIMATPRMALYIQYSVKVYSIYLKYVASKDIHVYSIDEVFMDVTDYLSYRNQTPREFAEMILKDVMDTVGITATCGIGTNLYLAKIAMDIIAKHAPGNIGILNEESYREKLWRHTPLTDFWRIGAGTVRRLSSIGIENMRDIALANEDTLYKHFGVDAELLIDHAWGRESVKMEDIKAYKPRSTSLSSGQVLSRGYAYEEGRIIVREMAEGLGLEMFEQGYSTNLITMSLDYSHASGREQSRGSMRIGCYTASIKKLSDSAAELYERIRDRDVPVHKVNICYCNLSTDDVQQYDMFSQPEDQEKQIKLQSAMLNIRKKHGKNGIFKCMDLMEGATMLERNRQIGGHRA